MRTVYKTSLSPKSILHENGLQNKPVTKKRKGLHTRKTNIQENSLITKQAFHQKAFSMKTFYKTSLHPKKQENSLQKKPFTKTVCKVVCRKADAKRHIKISNFQAMVYYKMAVLCLKENTKITS